MSAPSSRMGMGRLAAAIVVGLVIAAICGLNMYRTWTGLSTQDQAVDAERAGLVCARPLLDLAAALAVSGTAAAHGQAVDPNPVKAAVQAVAEVDIASRVGAPAGARWSDLSTRVGSLLDAGGRDSAGFMAAAMLTADLLAEVVENSGLSTDPDRDALALVDAALRQLPLVLIHTGRVGTVVGSDSAVLPASRYEIALRAGVVSASLARMADRSTGSRPAVQLNAPADAFQSAVRAVVPESLAQQPGSSTAAVALVDVTGLEAATLTLSHAMVDEIGGLVDARAGALAGQRRELLAGAGGASILVVTLLWLLSRPRGGDLRTPTGEEFGDEPAADVPQIAFIGARDLLGSEELVHIGRAVRAPQRRPDDAD